MASRPGKYKTGFWRNRVSRFVVAAYSPSEDITSDHLLYKLKDVPFVFMVNDWWSCHPYFRRDFIGIRLFPMAGSERKRFLRAQPEHDKKTFAIIGEEKLTAISSWDAYFIRDIRTVTDALELARGFALLDKPKRLLDLED